MSLADDSVWALNQSTSLDDLRALWNRVWRKYGEQGKTPPREVEAVKERRKRMHQSAETDKLLADLQHVLIIDSRHGKRDLEDWMRGVGWSTLRKAKAGTLRLTDDRLKMIKTIIAYGTVEDEALIDD